MLSSFLKQSAFTIVELLVTISIAGIAMAIAIPKLSEYIVELKVDNQISELNRLLHTARNAAINGGYDVIVCPISTVCTTNWGNDVSVFVDNNNSGDYDAGDTILKVKNAIPSGDKLQYGVKSLTYSAMGTLTSTVGDDPFSYCPSGYSHRARGILVSASGRTYVTSDTDNDDKDEDRDNNEITCT